MQLLTILLYGILTTVSILPSLLAYIVSVILMSSQPVVLQSSFLSNVRACQLLNRLSVLAVILSGTSKLQVSPSAESVSISYLKSVAICVGVTLCVCRPDMSLFSVPSFPEEFLSMPHDKNVAADSVSNILYVVLCILE